MKKVLFTSLNDHVNWGGSEVLWSNTAIELSKYYHVSALIKKWEKEADKIELLRENGITILYKNSKNSKSKNTILNKVINKIVSNKSSKKKSSFLQYDHVFISVGDHLDSKLIPLTTELRNNKVNYSIIVQLVTDLRNVKDSTIQRLSKAYTEAKNVFFLSEDNEFKTELFFAQELKNKVRINNPFNFNQNYTPLQDNNFNLACVAAFTSFHKSQDLLLSVLGQDKWIKRNFHLNLYGDGMNVLQIKKIIERYNLKEKVKIHGFVKSKEEIWKNNVVCIMPSRMEGQSLAMLEAMSHGRMVIATNVGDAKRLVVDNLTGFIIEAPTYELIDKALDKAWDKREEWISYGINARKHLFEQIKIDPVLEFAEKIKKIV